MCVLRGLALIKKDFVCLYKLEFIIRKELSGLCSLVHLTLVLLVDILYSV